LVDFRLKADAMSPKFMSSLECRVKAAELRNAAMTSPADAKGLGEAARVWDLIADELEREEVS
jgi:hypothetical protein